MTFNKLIALSVGMTLSNVLWAAVTISTPEEIVLLAVNDQEVRGGLLRTEKNDFKIDAGQQSISVRYQEFFQHLDGEHDILKSGVVTIHTPALQDGQQYKLALVDAPQSFEQAQRYAEQPTIALYDSNNRLVVQQTGANNETKPWLSSGLFGKVMDLTGKNKNNSAQQPPAVYATSTTQAQTTSMQPSATVDPAPTANIVITDKTGHVTADQRLIQIWQGATKQERQRFMSWLAEQ
ncbi:DUF2057 family protein [Acinetobacter larvae]|uniref:DUF2057 domain-containing protein n=1 Tax=Acinetobacter larvae TaxID=1789224 RepID=A0A1B2M424_9GAMM|nr:DUF2057 family protein [Acinetobacter larvae]AOA59956.1 hypothetical protein BFG52_09845 [Acinetobacter larvae]